MGSIVDEIFDLIKIAKNDEDIKRLLDLLYKHGVVDGKLEILRS